MKIPIVIYLSLKIYEEFDVDAFGFFSSKSPITKSCLYSFKILKELRKNSHLEEVLKDYRDSKTTY